MRLPTLLTAILLGATMGVHAQTECADYWKTAPRSSDVRFKVNGQSRAASVQVGIPTELNIIIYKGQDYRIALSWDEKILGEEVVVRIIEKVRGPLGKRTTGAAGEKGEEGLFRMEDTEKVIWDNQEHEMVTEVEFSATSTKRIAIEVMAPGPPDDPKDEKRGRVKPDIGCLGILIEHMPTPDIGF